MNSHSPPERARTNVDGNGCSAAPAGERRLRRFQRVLLDWYAENASVLPWRDRRDPYAVLVSEFMLQQTQRERVIPKFIAFMSAFPTIRALAAASPAAVIRAWAGLGYNSRALRLHQIATIVAGGSGDLPAETEALAALPGIGPYTAGAVACFGFGLPAAFADTNIRRVLRRVLCGEPYPVASPKRDTEIAALALPHDDAEAWNSALMDLGARICRAQKPRCGECPVARLCAAEPYFSREPPAGELRKAAEAPEPYRAGARARPAPVPFKSTDRYLRGRIVDALRGLPDGESITLDALARAATGMGLPGQDGRVASLVERLVKEGMVAVTEARSGEHGYHLPR